jgi:hypothetical protein
VEIACHTGCLGENLLDSVHNTSFKVAHDLLWKARLEVNILRHNLPHLEVGRSLLVRKQCKDNRNCPPVIHFVKYEINLGKIITGSLKVPSQ